MSKKIIRLAAFLGVAWGFIFPPAAQAVIPPDFIFNIGTQIAQFFSLIIIFLTAILGALFQFFKTKYYALKHKKTLLALGVILIISVSLAASYFYAIYKQKAEYSLWLKESQKYNLQEPITTDLESSPEEVLAIDYQESNNSMPAADANNLLNIGSAENQNIDSSQEKFVSTVNLTDSSAKFIKDYYENIANGRLERAYEMSKKSVAYSTFQGWYLKTTKITLNNLVRVDDKKSSIELTLYEGQEFTRYGVLMTLTLQGDTPVKVEKSEVKILSQGMVRDNQVTSNDNKIKIEYDFFTANESKDMLITNSAFKAVTNSQTNDYIVLDAREDIEYENGYFPDSQHIRFADLKAGRWIELPKDKFIYVLCWSGIRGKEVAEFLRTKKIVASYLENGANGWFEFGGKWVGSIKFGEKYTDPRYQTVFDTNEVKNKVNEGVVLVDTREPYKYKQWHIAGSLNIPIMYTATINLEDVFDQVPKGSKVITVCDGYVNCFDAKITGVELERRGNEFLGRYNKPWEYEK
jgi:rhodanese-related sulfurtransferase